MALRSAAWFGWALIYSLQHRLFTEKEQELRKWPSDLSLSYILHLTS